MDNQVPYCHLCSKRMQLQTENKSTLLYVCGCEGELKYLNVHKPGVIRQPPKVTIVRHQRG